MTEQEKETAEAATEETGSVTVPSTSGTKQPLRGFLRVGRRDLSEDELATPVTCRFLIADVEKQEEEIADLKEMLVDYNDIKIENALFKQQQKRSLIIDLSSYGLLSIGSAGLGASPSYIQVSAYGWIFFGLSVLLLGLGITIRILGWQVTK